MVNNSEKNKEKHLDLQILIRTTNSFERKKRAPGYPVMGIMVNRIVNL